jgi:aryl-alcohol dehydrogenase-like predicted oxidoreductase
MRLSTDADRDEERALAVIRAGLDAGVTLLDTAAAYGLDDADAHHNERIVARAIAGRPGVCVVTKGGMARSRAAWIADGRAKSLRASCEASLAALGRIDLYLLHAPDPKTPFGVSLRALRALQDEGLVARVGVCNVTRAELDEARGAIDLAAVQVALGASDAAFRDGVAATCARAGILVMAHSPLGGPARAKRLARDPLLAELARKYQTSAGAVLLAWLYGLDPHIVPIPGARRIETARQAGEAARIALDEEDRARLDARGAAGARAFGRSNAAAPESDAEVVLVMGIAGAGKSSHTAMLGGYERLNRDERGGTLRGVANDLDRALAAGGRRFVLDNTYCRRADRNRVIEVAERHGARVRCVWIDTPIEAAQVNAVERLFARHGRIPDAEGLAALDDPQAFAPTTQLRMQRELEPPAEDEGFASIEVVPFVRRPSVGERRGLIVALDALDGVDPARDPHDAVLIFGWRPEGRDDRAERWRAAHPDASVSIALCAHPGGPPKCWCRPPLPGLLIPWLHEERVDRARSLLVGVSSAHRSMAAGLGIPFEASLARAPG